MVSPLHKFITGLEYDPRLILARQDGDDIIAPDPKETEEKQGAIVICIPEKSSIHNDFSENLIMGPSSGTGWPGALLSANSEFVNGNIATLQIPRGPITHHHLSIDLPGIEDYDMPDIETPTQPSMERAIGRAVTWWLDNKYPEGFRNRTRISAQSSVAYSSEQLAVDLGINLKSVSTSVASHLRVNTSSDKKVSIMLVKQVYYSVAFQPPSDLAELFPPSVDVTTLQRYVSGDAPPVYVSRVDYGRIIMFRLETSATTTDVDAKFALNYATGVKSAEANAEARYKRITENSSMSVIAIGGNALATVQTIDAADIARIRSIATDPRNAELTRDNPALPIAYVTNFLRDGSLARIGVSTSYIKRHCVRYEHGFVRFVHSGAYVARFKASWMENNEEKHWESGNVTVGYAHTLNLPGNAKNVAIQAEAATGLVWQPWGEIFNLRLPGPTNRTYTARGTTLGRRYDVSEPESLNPVAA